ncbi:hypothetical protein DEQ92_20185, partial [Haloferax sp. Atlit-6N]
LLKRNYLPPEVFYEGFDRYKRKKLFEKLDLDDAGRVYDKDDEAPYRDQLRDIAGIERDEAAEVSQQRSDEYIQRFSRSQASNIVKLLRDDASEINLNSAGLTDMAEFLTRFEPAVVETAVDVDAGDADADELKRVRADVADDEDGSDADTDGEE